MGMKARWARIDAWARRLARSLITAYQWTLSPDKGIPSFWLKGRICAHEPHCSEYAQQCFKRYSFFRAFHYSMERILQCTPANAKHNDPSSYRVVFFSSAPIGEPFLRALHDDPRYDVVGVVTQPPASSGRWMKVRSNHIQTVTEALYGKEDDFVHTPRSLRLSSKKYADDAQAVHDRLKEIAPDFLVVVAYGNILPQSILDIPQFWPINVHGSLLPEYRGASPLQSVFLDKCTESWATIMLMNAWLDTGPILSKHTVPLAINDTVKEFINTLKEKAPQRCLDTIWAFAKWRIDPVEQDETIATHCWKITKEDGQIDPWNDSLDAIFAKYKAYALWPKIYFTMPKTDKRIIVEQVIVDEEIFAEHKDTPLFWVNHTVNPAITELLITPQGKKTISWEEFLRGTKETVDK